MIPVEDLQEGIQLCRPNVDRLFEDASILHQNGSYGRAQALAILAMEEYAKKIVLIAQKTHPREFDDQIRRSFWDHDFKLQLALDTLMKEFPNAPSDEEAASRVTDMARKLSSLKQASLYVDCDNKLGWLDPNKADYQNVVAVQIAYTKELVQRIDTWLERIQ